MDSYTTSYAYTLRDYQSDGVAQIRAAMRRSRRVCYVLPTGGGKTVIFAYIAWATARKGTRVIILAHRQEIADQISTALDAMGVAHGEIRPGERMSDHHVQVAMVQTLARRLEFVAPAELLVIDEAHHATAATWKKIMAAWPEAFVLGVTATPERLDGRGLREVGFEELVVGPDMGDLIAAGHLAPFRYLGAPVASFEGVGTVAGDFDQHEVEAIMASKAITGDVIAHYVRHLNNRTCIVFCSTVAHARMVAEEYNDAGIAAASIDGDMTRAERQDVVEALRSGRIKILTSCEVISEGFDAPAVGGCQLLRPTMSFALFRQQVGRCLRPKEDGSAAIILDHVQNYHRHGRPDEQHVWSLDSQKTKPFRHPTRECPACHEIFPIQEKRKPCPGKPDCVFAPKPGVPRVIRERGGELEDIANNRVAGDLSWAGGLNLGYGHYVTLLTLAEGKRERLEQIAAARGYKRGWVWHAERAWARGERPVSAMKAWLDDQQRDEFRMFDSTSEASEE